MIGLVSRLLRRGQPVLSDAGPRDAAAISILHGASFRRGWSEDELERLLIERNVVADRAMLGRSLAGFILSRCAADEAEILSIAVDAGARGRGIGRSLLQRHLRRLAGIGIRAVFLEVDAGNEPALRLYARMGFAQVGRREHYYQSAGPSAGAALVLRRDLG